MMPVGQGDSQVTLHAESQGISQHCQEFSLMKDLSCLSFFEIISTDNSSVFQNFTWLKWRDNILTLAIAVVIFSLQCAGGLWLLIYLLTETCSLNCCCLVACQTVTSAEVVSLVLIYRVSQEHIGSLYKSQEWNVAYFSICVLLS